MTTYLESCGDNMWAFMTADQDAYITTKQKAIPGVSYLVIAMPVPDMMKTLSAFVQKDVEALKQIKPDLQPIAEEKDDSKPEDASLYQTVLAYLHLHPESPVRAVAEGIGLGEDLDAVRDQINLGRKNGDIDTRGARKGMKYILSEKAAKLFVEPPAAPQDETQCFDDDKPGPNATCVLEPAEDDDDDIPAEEQPEDDDDILKGEDPTDSVPIVVEDEDEDEGEAPPPLTHGLTDSVDGQSW